MTAIDELLAAVQASAKYRTIAPTVIRPVAEQALAQHRSHKAALKATKNKLHQVAGAYFVSTPNYPAALAQLQAAPNAADLRTVLRSLMRQHASTAERLPILDTFFATTLAELPPITRVLDLACGLNPLAAPWLPLAPNATYIAVDIYTDLMDFLAQALPLLGCQPQTIATNLLAQPALPPADLALLLKALPCLEQLDRPATQALLAYIPARHVLVSYPASSLGGHKKGMPSHYAAQFQALVADQPWQVQRFDFATELAFLVTKPSA